MRPTIKPGTLVKYVREWDGTIVGVRGDRLNILPGTYALVVERTGGDYVLLHLPEGQKSKWEWTFFVQSSHPSPGSTHRYDCWRVVKEPRNV